MKKIITLLAVVLMIISLCACGNDFDTHDSSVSDIATEDENTMKKSTVLTNENETVELTIDDLISSYDENEAKFNKLYLGAKINFEGTIKSIKTETGVIVEEGGVVSGQNKIVFEEGWCLVVGANNTEIDLANLDIGEVVNVTTSIVGAPYDTDFLKTVSGDNRVLWLVGDDKIYGRQYSEIKTIIEKQ